MSRKAWILAVLLVLISASLATAADPPAVDAVNKKQPAANAQFEQKNSNAVKTQQVIQSWAGEQVVAPPKTQRAVVVHPPTQAEWSCDDGTYVEYTKTGRGKNVVFKWVLYGAGTSLTYELKNNRLYLNGSMLTQSQMNERKRIHWWRITNRHAQGSEQGAVSRVDQDPELNGAMSSLARYMVRGY